MGGNRGKGCPEDAPNEPTTHGGSVGTDPHNSLTLSNCREQRKQLLPGGRYWQYPEEFTNTLVWNVASNLSSALETGKGVRELALPPWCPRVCHRHGPSSPETFSSHPGNRLRARFAAELGDLQAHIGRGQSMSTAVLYELCFCFRCV